MSIIKNITGSNHNSDVLKKTIDYCNEDFKTDNGKYVTSLGCSDDDVYGSMLAVKRIYKKEDGRQFEASMISISPAGNQYSNEKMLQIGVECGKFWYNKGFQTTIALHLDSEYRHFHIIVNSVSYINGKKLKMNLKFYNEYRTHCSKILHNYGLDAIRTPAAKIIDKEQYTFEEDLNFLEAYDEIFADNGLSLMEMLENAQSLDYSSAITEEELRRLNNPDYPVNGYNRFLGYNNEAYREYWNIGNGKTNDLGWNKPYFQPNSVRPMSPLTIDDLLPPPIIVHDKQPDTDICDEYLFTDNGAILRINCSRKYELDIPKGYTEEQVRKIVENLPRISEDEKNIHSKRATAASGTLKRHNIEGQVELDFSETIKFNWSDGTSSTIPHITFSDESDSNIIDVEGEDID